MFTTHPFNHLMDIYIALAIGFNLISLTVLEIKDTGLTPTDPVQGIVTMVVLYCTYLNLHIMAPVTAVMIIGSFIFMIIRFGVVRHLLGYGDDKYVTRGSWFLAIVINVFGVCVLLFTLTNVFTRFTSML